MRTHALSQSLPTGAPATHHGRLKRKFAQLLASADIAIDGERPWDIRVRDDRLYRRLFLHGSLGAGEAYMDGWWDCEQLDDLIYRLLRSHLRPAFESHRTNLWGALGSRLINQQSRSRAFTVGEVHYDIGNTLYERMLDSRMIYSCGYWREAATLEDAQAHKLKLICQKLNLSPGMRVLDIGCGWGGLARYMAQDYGVAVVGLTISQAQADYARTACRNLPIEIRLQDYRELNDVFDRVVSVGMFEHVGYKNYRAYMKTVARCLKDDGLFLLHTIGSTTTSHSTDPWINHYIFPNSMLPSIKQIATASEGLWVMEDWHNFSADYDKTLMAWHGNFTRAWPQLSATYSERFRRMWRYYLLTCAGTFRARDNQLWQIVFSKNGVLGGYASVR